MRVLSVANDFWEGYKLSEHVQLFRTVKYIVGDCLERHYDIPGSLKINNSLDC